MNKINESLDYPKNSIMKKSLSGIDKLSPQNNVNTTPAPPNPKSEKKDTSKLKK